MNQWKLIPGTNNYYASDDGVIKSVIGKRTKILSQWSDAKGYLRVKIILNSKSTGIAVHRLVALAFIPNPENKPQVNHKDGNKKNNSAQNLEWNTCAENVKHAWLNNLSIAFYGEDNPNSKLTEGKAHAIRIIYALNKATMKELGEIFKVSKATIAEIIYNKTWKFKTKK